jgi:ABC-2 type transport system permease protein
MKQKESSKIRYYSRIWVTMLKHSLSKASTFRLEVVARALRGIFLVVVQVILINAIIGDSETFVGWTKHEMYLLAGVFNTINYVSWSLFSINLWRLEEKILKGEFDFILTKPYSSIFGASFTEFFVDDFVSAISGVMLIGYYVINHFSEITLLNSFLFLISSLSAFLIWFSFELLFASFDFIKIKNGLREVKKQLVGIGKFPIDIWNGNVKYIFYTFLPIAFVGSVPARVFQGYFDWKYVVFSVLISILFFLIARFVWYKALRRYSSVG